MTICIKHSLTVYTQSASEFNRFATIYTQTQNAERPLPQLLSFAKVIKRRIEVSSIIFTVSFVKTLRLAVTLPDVYLQALLISSKKKKKKKILSSPYTPNIRINASSATSIATHAYIYLYKRVPESWVTFIYERVKGEKKKKRYPLKRSLSILQPAPRIRPSSMLSIYESP